MLAEINEGVDKSRDIVELNHTLKRVPPENSNVEIGLRRQKDKVTDSEPSKLGCVAEGFLINHTPSEIKINVSPEANSIDVNTRPVNTQRDNVDDSSAPETDFLAKQNIKYINGDLEVKISGIDLNNISDETARRLIAPVDQLIAGEGIWQMNLSIAEISALYQLRLRLDVNTRNLAPFAPNIKMPEKLSDKKLGEPFGQLIEFNEETDVEKTVGKTVDGKDIPLSNGIWFSFKTDESGNTKVFDAVYKKDDGTVSEPGIPRQAVSLLEIESDGIKKYVMGIEYSPATGAYELVAIGGGFKPEQGEEGIKKRIEKAIQAEASEEQGLKIDNVLMLTEKPILNAPDLYVQETYPALAKISSKGEKDTENADEVTELGMVSLSSEDLDALILKGVIKDPSIIAARALIVAKKITL